jgi:hypothetical protein
MNIVFNDWLLLLCLGFASTNSKQRDIYATSNLKKEKQDYKIES